MATVMFVASRNKAMISAAITTSQIPPVYCTPHSASVVRNSAGDYSDMMISEIKRLATKATPCVAASKQDGAAVTQAASLQGTAMLVTISLGRLESGRMR
jgi:hypothetical protein